MRVLRKGLKGEDVRQWQVFLRGQGQPLEVTGEFDKATEDATIAFQKAKNLAADGVAGNQTFGQAMLIGFELVADARDASKEGPNFPPLPAFKPLARTADRQRVFGAFEFVSKPLPSNPENIQIKGDWESRNIERVIIPQLVGIQGASSDGGVRFHRLAAKQLAALWQAWQKAKLLDRVLTYDGGFVPRFIRGSRTELSNHAFGTAFDINASMNGLGVEPPRVGDRGCVRELVQLANEHGFFWGGHFPGRRDGMHFEVAIIKDAEPSPATRGGTPVTRGISAPPSAPPPRRSAGAKRRRS